MGATKSPKKNGAALWKSFLRRNKITPVMASKALGFSRATIIDWADEKKVPVPDNQHKIARYTRGAVPVDSWPPQPGKQGERTLEEIVPWDAKAAEG